MDCPYLLKEVAGRTDHEWTIFSFNIYCKSRELTIGLYSEWLFFSLWIYLNKVNYFQEYNCFTDTTILLKSMKTIETNESHFMYFINI